MHPSRTHQARGLPRPGGELAQTLEVTDGNLASHTKALEKEAYIKVEKQFIGRKPNTRYAATASGKKAFEKHIEALEKLIGK